MQLLTYTQPEDRWIPDTFEQNYSYSFTEKDPFWRRALMSLGLKIISLADRMFLDTEYVNPIDHLRWFVEGIGMQIFSLGMNGSWSEIRMILNSEIPWKYVEPDFKRKLLAEFPEYFVPAPPARSVQSA